jgi:flagellar hook-associated protein 2
MASSNSTSTSSSSGRLRITGLSSGLDVDSIVEQMMSAEKTKLSKLKQKEQLVTWKQEAYRSITGAVKEFSDKYFSLTSAASLLKQSNFQKFKATSSDDAITVSAGANAVKGSHAVTVSQLATAGVQTGSGRLSKDIQGTEAANFTSAQGKSFKITLDGTERTVTLDASVTDVASLQDAVDNAVGAGKVVVSTDAVTSALVFTAADNSGVNKITLNGGTSDVLTNLGFGSGAIYTNRISTSASLETIASQLNTTLTFDADGEIEMSINGASFTFDKSVSLDDMIKKINAGDIGATLKYDELADKMVLTSGESGAGSTIELAETGGNFLEVALDLFVEGDDAKFTIDDISLTRSSNEFILDGITYTFNDTISEKATVNITQDTDGIYENISNFVSDYNTLIKTINDTMSEKYDYDYPPLTDEQKKDMSDKEIEVWETKAKTGILANDPILQKMVDSLRSALVEGVDGQSLNIFGIGITPSSNYYDNGKLEVDATKLKAAIAADPEGIMNLFTQQSEKYSGTTTVRTLSSGARAIRYQEEGLAYRFYDIIQDNIGTVRDSGGNKGFLLEKAGMEDDSSETENTITKQLKEYAEQIKKEEERLEEFEEDLYTKYSSLETYISSMNTRLNALLSMFEG